MQDREPIHIASTVGSVLTLSISASTINTEDALRLQEEFRSVLLNLPADIRTIHLEVSTVLAMSSRGFESLLLLHRGCTEHEIHLTVSKLTPIFQRLLSRMGFLRFLKVDET